MKDGEKDSLKAITRCCQRLFGEMAPTVSWGLSALQSLTLGQEFATLTAEAQRELRNIPSYAFYGVRSEDAIAMRLMRRTAVGGGPHGRDDRRRGPHERPRGGAQAGSPLCPRRPGGRPWVPRARRTGRSGGSSTGCSDLPDAGHPQLVRPASLREQCGRGGRSAVGVHGPRGHRAQVVGCDSGPLAPDLVLP